MTSKINALSTGVGGLATTADASGILELQTNNTTAVTVDGSQVVSFDNNFGTVAGLPSYQCRAWVNFNGTGTVAIRESGNVSSITDNGTADYTINFTTAMPDTNYHASGSMSATPGSAYAGSISLFTQGTTEVAPTTSAFRITTANGNNALVDPKYVCLSVFR